MKEEYQFCFTDRRNDENACSNQTLLCPKKYVLISKTLNFCSKVEEHCEGVQQIVPFASPLLVVHMALQRVAMDGFLFKP